MGFSLVFSKPMVEKVGVFSDGSKDRHHKNSAFTRPRLIILGDKQGARASKKARTATGLSPDMNYSPHFTIALRQWLTSAADRPAGTREALPGTISRNLRSTFFLEGICTPLENLITNDDA
jgi:hypothetical protein